MKRLSVILLTLLAFATSFAQEDTGDDGKRQKFMTEIRNYKHNFLIRELDLTREQQKEFFPVYDELEEKISDLNSETRDLERKISENLENASDLELEKATEAIYELKIKEGETEKEYAEKFKDILTKKQLFLLKGAERNFSRELLQHQSRLRRRARS